MALAALFAGGLLMTILLGNGLQQRATGTVDSTYSPAADAVTDEYGWPVRHPAAGSIARQPNGVVPPRWNVEG
jgi:hypothetical protein